MMNLLVDGNLTYPPSEISCVRDLTLFSVTWTEFTVLIEIKSEYKDHVWKHLKSHGAWDYFEDIVSPCREHGLKLSDQPASNIRVDYIRCENLNFILSRLKGFG